MSSESDSKTARIAVLLNESMDSMKFKDKKKLLTLIIDEEECDRILRKFLEKHNNRPARPPTPTPPVREESPEPSVHDSESPEPSVHEEESPEPSVHEEESPEPSVQEEESPEQSEKEDGAASDEEIEYVEEYATDEYGSDVEVEYVEEYETDPEQD